MKSEKRDSKIKILFGTVLYPQSYQFFEKFMSSIKHQTYKDFDLLIIYEEINKKDIEPFIKGFQGLVLYKKIEAGKPIYLSRCMLLEIAKIMKYDLLILGDSDDYFYENRVERYLESYDDSYVAYYNHLVDFENNRIFPELKEVTLLDDLIEKNYLGLTNTGINLNRLNSDILKKMYLGKTNIFDWYMFSILLNCVGNAKLVPNTGTYYRIYSNNIADNRKDIRKEINVKLNHYQLLLPYEPFHSYFLRYKAIDNSITVKLLLEKYQNVNRKLFWWNSISIKNEIY